MVRGYDVISNKKDISGFNNQGKSIFILLLGQAFEVKILKKTTKKTTNVCAWQVVVL